MKHKRISLYDYDCEHLYELSLQHFQKECGECQRIKKKVEKFIGKKEVAWVKRIIKNHPYCKTK